MGKVSIRGKIFMSLVVCACLCLVFGTVAWAAAPTATTRQLTTSSYDSWFGSWSPDGQWVVYQQEGSGSYNYGNIHKIRVDGTGDLTLTGGYYCDSKPSFSPDGTKIVFQRHQSPAGVSNSEEKASIWVMNADGRRQLLVAKYMRGDKGGAQWPVWSPDGTHIAYWCGKEDLKALCVIRPDRSGLLKLTSPTFGTSPHGFVNWVPGGSNILLSLKNEANTFGHNRHIALVSAYGWGVEWLTDQNGDACQLNEKMSPNGKKIAYQDDADKRSDIWVMRANGSNRVRLTDAASTSRCYTSPDWSPNGRYIVYWALDNYIYGTINIMTADGQKSLVLMNDPSLRNNDNDSRFLLRFNRQGTRILFQGDDTLGRAQLYVLDLNIGDDDSDALLNWEEDVWGTSRTDADSDDDGVNDGTEVRRGTDPLDPGSV